MLLNLVTERMLVLLQLIRTIVLFVNGLAQFKFAIVAYKVIVNFSANLFVISNQLTTMLTESNVTNVVLPPLYAVTDIVKQYHLLSISIILTIN